jgi:aminoglycoside 6'-N-acetyltransferase
MIICEYEIKKLFTRTQMADQQKFSPLETARLLLRPFEPGDAQGFSNYRSDPEVARYQGWDAPYSLTKAEQFVAEMQQTRPGGQDDWYQVAVELKSEGVLIGDIGFKIFSVGQQAELGFTLASAYQGKGYAFESMHRILQYLFEQFGLHRIQANCDPRNGTSVRLLERLGMRREGHMIENVWYKGEWADEYWYAVLRREWNPH